MSDNRSTAARTIDRAIPRTRNAGLTVREKMDRELFDLDGFVTSTGSGRLRAAYDNLLAAFDEWWNPPAPPV